MGCPYPHTDHRNSRAHTRQRDNGRHITVERGARGCAFRGHTAGMQQLCVTTRHSGPVSGAGAVLVHVLGRLSAHVVLGSKEPQLNTLRLLHTHPNQQPTAV